MSKKISVHEVEWDLAKARIKELERMDAEHILPLAAERPCRRRKRDLEG